MLIGDLADRHHIQDLKVSFSNSKSEIFIIRHHTEMWFIFVHFDDRDLQVVHLETIRQANKEEFNNYKGHA